MNPKYSFKDFIRGNEIGQVIGKLADDLNLQQLPQSVQNILTGYGIPISNIGISTVVANKEWEVTIGQRSIKVIAEKINLSARAFKVILPDFRFEQDLPPGTEIIGACFARESYLGEPGDPMREIFPASMTGVIFKRCNLDNCVIPAGNILMEWQGIPCTNRRIRMQNDLEDWIVNQQGKPQEPVALKKFLRLGLSVDPKDIPNQPLDRPITEVTEEIV
jgi:hypothetical protein